MSLPNSQSAAFSLVEVTLALGIMAFCLVTMFGLLPTGLNTGRDAVEQTAAAGIAGALAADLRQTPAATTTSPNPQSPQYLISVPTPTGSQIVTHTLFLTDVGAVATANAASSGQDQKADPTQNPRFRATMVFSRQNATVADRSATNVRILITWPALADPTGGILPQQANSSFEMMIALDRN